MQPLHRLFFLTICLFSLNVVFAQSIDRKAVVQRHRVVLNKPDTLGSLTVGNGRFAFTVDVTGLQSFPEHYAHGIPLGTQSEWGWHRFPNPQNFRLEEALDTYEVSARKGRYAVQFKKQGRSQQASDYFRQNPHRLQLGNIGLLIKKKDGSLLKLSEVENLSQELDPWTGIIVSVFSVEGTPVSVTTCAHADNDMIAFRVESELLTQKRLSVRFRFPYPTNTFTDHGVNYTNAAAHQTGLMQTPNGAVFSRKLDNDSYVVAARWKGKAIVQKQAEHDYVLQPGADSRSFETVVGFSPKPTGTTLPDFVAVLSSSLRGWKTFWQSGGAVDFAGSTDPRAAELERRVVLSQYLIRAQSTSEQPPQETGLTYNSWYGRPHMEMHWWHSVHHALWGRPELMEKSLQWYFRNFDGAKAIANRQGFKGVRWQKMTDPDGGESPSSVGSFLIWQQPHIIYMAELLYRNKPSKAILQRYQKLIFATADFMASFATLDPKTGRYNLGKGIIPAQECFNPMETFNSPYELAYWKWGLQQAQQWRKRLGMPADPTWQAVIDKLAPLAQANGVYKAAESIEDSYSPNSKVIIDHPAVLAALSSLPANGVVDTTVMHHTFDIVERVWTWGHTWGWDFPMVAMTATRLHQPHKALNALFKPITTNTYLVNGHNFQDKRLTLYLPGNGSLLTAVALMCAGADGDKITNPGFPKDGSWKVRWEGLKRMP